ncbi:MAG TPA: SDR family oxidoreductase [Gemmatimonadales bacterium]|nr:SDR family oxidoreductase [Gemmatimonadales bacterium]
MPDTATALAGKTVLVTGATSGIGRETARALARLGATVIVGARDPARGEAMVAELKRAGGSAELLVIDLAAFDSVRHAAAQVTAAHPRLDVLVNNAGIATRQRQLSPDGHELTWATNFLGGFLLTRLLLPALRRAPEPRVVNVSSGAHVGAHIRWDDLERERNFRGYSAYAQSKLAQVLFTRELARREPRIAVTAVHPGVIRTAIWRAGPFWLRWLFAVVLPSARRGARPVVRLAAAPELARVTGRYFDRLREAAPSDAATSAADAARLWRIAEEATAGPGVADPPQ